MGPCVFRYIVCVNLILSLLVTGPVTDGIRPIKGIYLSKALTSMKFFLYKQKCFFYQGDGYLCPLCCMNNLYISHTYSF